MKQLPLMEGWSLALHVRDDGQRVGVVLRAKTIEAELLCLIAEERAFAIVRFPPTARQSTRSGRDIRQLLEPVRSPLDITLYDALEQALSRELGMPTQVVLAPSGWTIPMRVITVPPAGE